MWASCYACPALEAESGGRASCWRCMRPRVACVCELITRVEQETRVVIVQHPRESRHAFNTVRFARLGLTDVEVQIPDTQQDGSLRCHGATVQPSALLYPSADATDLREFHPRPKTLVVLDGTWSTAHKLMRDSPWLDSLPRASLTPPRPGNYRIRRAPDPSRQLSTIEAIVYALQALEGDSEGLRQLLVAFDTMVDWQLAAERRGALGQQTP